MIPLHCFSLCFSMKHHCKTPMVAGAAESGFVIVVVCSALTSLSKIFQ